MSFASTTPQSRRGEHRRSIRKRVLKGGVITYAARQTSIPCVVRDISEGGAHLMTDLAPHLPQSFHLIIEIDGIEVDCELAWRKAKDVGVRFVALPRAIARRRLQVLGEAGTPVEEAKPSLRRNQAVEPVKDVSRPHAQAGAPDATASPAPAGPADIKQSIPILIAEDDPDDQAFIAEAFKEVGFNGSVVFVEDGVALLRYLRAEDEHRDRVLPGLILLDLNMPRMDGRTALVQIKATRQLRRIPVVVFSTSNVERDVETTYDLGVASYIPKPATAAELNEIVRQLTSYWGNAVRFAAR